MEGKAKMVIITIPKQLQQPQFRFILLKQNRKEPIELEWSDKNNYKYDDEKLIKHLAKGWNYGVVGGYGNLILIDADNEEIAQICEGLPDTFTVKTGSPEEYKKHYYFITDKKMKGIRLSREKQGDLGDIRSTGQYVVAPNSIHPSGNKYEVIKDLPITTIKKETIRNKFKKYINLYQPADFEIGTRNLNPYIKNCLVPKYISENKLKSNTSKNYTLFRYVVDIEFNRGGDWKNRCLQTCVKQGHQLGAITGWIQKAEINKIEKSNCGKMKAYLNQYHPELIEEICGKCRLNEDYYQHLIEVFLASPKDGMFEIANYLLNDYSFKTLNDTEEILVYDGGVYIYNGEKIIAKEIQFILGCNNSMRITNEIIGHIKRSTYIKREEFENIPKHLLCLENGVLNLKTMELEKYDENVMFLNKLPISFEENIGCPQIIKFFNEVLNQEDLPVIQELIGYLLLKSMPFHKAFMFVGGGANGKSTLLNLIKHFLGKGNVTSISLQNLEYQQFSIANLYGKMANLFADLPQKSLNITSMFKILTGEDLITAEKKFKNGFNFVNYAKLIFSTNQIPKVIEDTDAFFRRWIIINFPNQFLENANPLLLKELTTKEELSGLLNFAIEGLKRLITQGKFSTTSTLEEVREEYIRKSDSVGAFVMDKIEIKPDNYETKKEFYTHYTEYCRNNKYPIVSENIFHKELQMKIRIEDYRPTIDGIRTQCWKGIIIIEKNLDNLDNLDNPDRNLKIHRRGQRLQSKLMDVCMSGMSGKKEVFKYNGRGRDNKNNILNRKKNLDIPDNPDRKPPINKKQIIMNIINNLTEKFANGLIPLEILEEKALKKQIKPEQFEEIIEKLKWYESQIFEPKPGFVKKL